MDKPLVGIMPERIWKIKRMEDLRGAIYRYLEADQIPMREWYEEYEKLVRELRR